MPFRDIYRNRRVLVTGHTGFKGSWLCEWLIGLGADVMGYSLPPPTDPALFEQLGLAARLRHVEGDVRNLAALQRSVADFAPEFVFHLAAQPLVRLSYSQPVETYATNVMGTAHVLEALRQVGRPCTAILITTDKCYENKEWVHAYREEDPLGGYDPYSSSKGAAEIVIAAYRRSYFSAPESPIRVASARAGNVIGGGDWAADRIVPDCIRCLQSSQPIAVRNKTATRPWQHVLEPLSGYLWLGAALSGAGGKFPAHHYVSSFNFGPSLTSNRTVEELVRHVLSAWPGTWEDRSDPKAPHEAKFLNLSIEKAYHLLDWWPVWNFETSIERTVTWYRQTATAEATAADLTRRDIARYVTDAEFARLPWTK